MELFTVIHTLGGIYGRYTPLYTPWEAYMGGIPCYTHPGKHIREVYPVIPTLGGIVGYIHHCTHPGRYGRVYTTVHTLGGMVGRYTPLLYPGMAGRYTPLLYPGMGG